MFVARQRKLLHWCLSVLANSSVLKVRWIGCGRWLALTGENGRGEGVLMEGESIFFEGDWGSVALVGGGSDAEVSVADIPIAPGLGGSLTGENYVYGKPVFRLEGVFERFMFGRSYPFSKELLFGEAVIGGGVHRVLDNGNGKAFRCQHGRDIIGQWRESDFGLGDKENFNRRVRG